MENETIADLAQQAADAVAAAISALDELDRTVTAEQYDTLTALVCTDLTRPGGDDTIGNPSHPHATDALESVHTVLLGAVQRMTV